jgi:hypothetical protein
VWSSKDWPPLGKLEEVRRSQLITTQHGLSSSQQSEQTLKMTHVDLNALRQDTQHCAYFVVQCVADTMPLVITCHGGCNVHQLILTKEAAPAQYGLRALHSTLRSAHAASKPSLPLLTLRCL